MRAVYLKELKLNFTGFTGYLYGAFILLFVGIYTMGINLSGGYAQFEYVLESMAFIYLIACPVLTMRAFAEEKRSKTDQLLYSLPIRLSDVVVGKYLAMLTVSLLPVAVVSAYPLLLSGYGHVDMRSAYASILMFFLLGACLTSIGMFISSVTENQVTSAVVTLGDHADHVFHDLARQLRIHRVLVLADCAERAGAGTRGDCVSVHEEFIGRVSDRRGAGRRAADCLRHRRFGLLRPVPGADEEAVAV